MCRSMVDIQSPTAEIRWGKKRKKKKIERNYRMKILWSALLHRATIIKPVTGWSPAMQQYSILNEKMLFLCLCISPGSAEALCIWGKKKQSTFDCLLYQQQSCQKLSKSIHVCQTNSMTKYLHFLRHSVVTLHCKNGRRRYIWRLFAKYVSLFVVHCALQKLSFII